MPPDDVVDAWRALAVAAENPFALPEWLDAWCAAHPGDAPRIVVCRREDGSVAGVLPLVARGHTLLGPGDAALDVLAPACAPADAAAVARAVLGAPFPPWRLWRLERGLAGAAWLEAVKSGARPAGLVLRPWRAEPPLVVVDLSSQWLEPRQRREHERLRRRLAEDHEVAVRTSEGADAVRRDLAVLLRLHAERWGAGTFPPSVRAFHLDFATRAAERGWLRLDTLDVDGRPAAALYGWQLGARAFAYSHAFDAAYARYGVGVALLTAVMERATAAGCTHFDLLRGDEAFKRRFRPASHRLESHLVARRRSAGAAEALARSTGRRAWARLPARGRALLGRLRSRQPRASLVDPPPVAVQQPADQ